MAIANAVQRGSTVYVYDERGRLLATISAGNGLQGYTSGNVTIRRGSSNYIYDERGRLTGTTSA